jgi:hypothetical protein
LALFTVKTASKLFVKFQKPPHLSELGFEHS